MMQDLLVILKKEYIGYKNTLLCELGAETLKLCIKLENQLDQEFSKWHEDFWNRTRNQIITPDIEKEYLECKNSFNDQRSYEIHVHMTSMTTKHVDFIKELDACDRQFRKRLEIQIYGNPRFTIVDYDYEVHQYRLQRQDKVKEYKNSTTIQDASSSSSS